jgi:hypothetical protein
MRNVTVLLKDLIENAFERLGNGRDMHAGVLRLPIEI